MKDKFIVAVMLVLLFAGIGYGQWINTNPVPGSSTQVTDGDKGDITISGGVWTIDTFAPDTADGAALGSGDYEFSDLYLADGGVIYGQGDQSNTLTSSATGWTANLNLAAATYGSDGSVTDAELLYVDATSSIQDQLDARCLESVFGTALEADDLQLNGTTLELVAEILHSDAAGTITGDWELPWLNIDERASAPTGVEGRWARWDEDTWNPGGTSLGYGGYAIYNDNSASWIINFDNRGALHLSNTPLDVSDDPDVSASNYISLDTDGWLRVFNDSKQKAVRLDFDENYTIVQPDDMDETDDIPLWCNHSGMSLYIMTIYADSDVDDADFTLVSAAYNNFDTESTIEAITVSTDGTGVYTYTIGAGAGTDIDDNQVDDGECILFDPSADDIAVLHIQIQGYFDGNVN